MKVAVTARALGGRLEGIGHYTKELLSVMISTHPEVDWHIIYDQRDGRYTIDHPSVTNHFLSPPMRHPWLIVLWLEYRLPRLIRQIDPDVIWYPDGLMSLKLTVPSVLTVHDLAYAQYPQGSRRRDLNYYKKYMPRYIERADKLITISNYTRDAIISYYSRADHKIEVIYNGVSQDYRPLDTDVKEEFLREYTDGKPYILYLGAIHPRKNVIAVIHAFDRLKERGSDYKLVLAGRMAWRSDDVQSAIRNSSYQADIIQLSDIDDIITSCVGSAAMLCMMSYTEGFGLPVVEAMAAGVPVITTAESAMSEIGGGAVVTCDPDNVDAIRDAMQRIIDDPMYNKELSRKGIDQAAGYDWDQAATSVFQSLLSTIHHQRI